jgi:hypothetical protein
MYRNAGLRRLWQVHLPSRLAKKGCLRVRDPLEPLDPGGVTDFDGDDVLIELFGARAAMVPKSAQKMPTESKLLLATLIRQVQEVYELQAALEGTVEQLREQNASWRIIGWGLGTTGEAARQRFGGAA